MRSLSVGATACDAAAAVVALGPPDASAARRCCVIYDKFSKMCVGGVDSTY